MNGIKNISSRRAHYIVEAAKGLGAFQRALEVIAEHYAHSAPSVASWIDALYLDLADNRPVDLSELSAALHLYDVESQTWTHPNFAANAAYKAAARAGRDVTGLAGF